MSCLEHTMRIWLENTIILIQNDLVTFIIKYKLYLILDIYLITFKV